MTRRPEKILIDIQLSDGISPWTFLEALAEGVDQESRRQLSRNPTEEILSEPGGNQSPTIRFYLPREPRRGHKDRQDRIMINKVVITALRGFVEESKLGTVNAYGSRVILFPTEG